jgi:hypothetical protein
MKYCPKCKSQYSDDMSFCLMDGDALLVNDPEAETLKGRVIRPSKLVPKRVIGEAIEKLVWLTKDRPYSLVHSEITVILLLKELQVKNPFTPYSKAAHLAFFGNRPFHHGDQLHQVGPNEYFMPEEDNHLEQDISVFYQELSNGHGTLLRIYISEILPRRVKVNIGLLLTKPES